MMSTFSAVDNAHDFEDDDAEDPMGPNEIQPGDSLVSEESLILKDSVDQQQMNV